MSQVFCQDGSIAPADELTREEAILARIEEHLAAIRGLLEGVTAGLTNMMQSPMGRFMGKGQSGG